MKAANRIYECRGHLANNYSFKILNKDGGEFRPPSSLFKFYALTDYNVEAVRSFSFWASDKWQLNYPFDCHQGLIDFNNLNESDKEIINQMFRDVSLSFEDKCYWLFVSIFKELGIVSLTQQDDNKPLNKLMWAHYTNNRGFCIEFAPDKLLNDQLLGVFPINYVNKIEAEKWDIKNDAKGFEPFLYLTNVKYDEWEYENEWRIIAFKKSSYMHLSWYNDNNKKESANRLFDYNSEAIKSITLGPLFFDFRKEINDEKSFFNIDNEYKRRLLDFIIANEIRTYWIANPEFRLRNKQILNFEQYPIKLGSPSPGKYTFDIP